MDRIGRYKIVRELGRGAMGVVYHAIDPNIGRPVAIKTIRLGEVRDAGEHDRLRERLFREARSAGILSHPGIVTIYDVEQQGDLAYIAMEYVDGPTLDQLLTAGQALAPERMFSILGQTSTALDFAHQKGIVHRDIKPANIMITADGTAKITDFGIAKIAANEQLTMTGSIVGTPHYMSPEQVQGQPVDGRSDQFSLAVIAFEMLTGEKPYTGEHLTTVVYKIVAEEPPPPTRLNPSLSGAIESALRKGLSKKPDGRYRTCQEFVDGLEKACAASRGWKPIPRGGGLNEPTMAEAAGPAARMPEPRRARADDSGTGEHAQGRKSGFLGFIAAVLAAATLLALIGWQADPSLPQKLQWLTQKVQAVLWPPPSPNTAGTPPQQAARRAEQPPVAAAPAPAPVPAPAPAPVPVETKPSPMPAEPRKVPPPEEAAGSAEAPSIAERQTAPGGAGPGGRSQPVTVISSPGGATATLDGRADAACTTPCTLDASPGRHTIAVTMPGYQVEHRDVTVGSGPVELPAVVLRASGGTLMLTSVPPGAAILVNGRRLAQTTPAQLPLAPGPYEITVERAGRQNTSRVEIRDGEIKTLKILLEQ